MISAEDTVVSLVGNSGLATIGTDLFAGPVRPPGGYIPKQVIFVLEATGGREPQVIHNEQRGYMRRPGVQVRVRAESYESGYTLAEDVWQALADVTSPAPWTQMRMQQSAPIYTGRTEDELFHWSINVELIG